MLESSDISVGNDINAMTTKVLRLIQKKVLSLTISKPNNMT